MVNINESRPSIDRVQLETEFKQRGARLVETVRDRLGVSQVGILDLPLLTGIAGSTFANQEFSGTLVNPAGQAAIFEQIHSPSKLISNNIPLHRARQVFLDLVGHGELAKGSVAAALGEAHQALNSEELHELQWEFGFMFAAAETLSPDPNVHPLTLVIDSNKKIIQGVKIQTRLPSELGTFIEYGPGLIGGRRIREGALDKISHTFMIELGAFQQGYLQTLGRLYGLTESNGRLIVAETGIKAATENLLDTHAESVDLIVGSSIQTAGTEQLTAGLVNGYQLLRQNGLLVMRLGEELTTQDTLTATQMVQLARAVFKKSPTYQETIPMRNHKLQKNTKGIEVVFRK